MSYLEQILEASAYLKVIIADRKPELALILGSGLGDLAEQITNPISVSYREIPHFPVSTVAGHAGQFVIGELEGKCVIAMQGRFHYYEGYAMRKVTLPIYVMKQLGVNSLVITNAAGGMNRDFQAGDLMLLSDHLNLTGDNPLIGSNSDELGLRFPDMSEAYSRSYRELAHRVSQEITYEFNQPLKLQEGVYAGISGPAYMTPAELTMLANLGGDAVGMSTVGEVIAAKHCGMQVLGISCITDMAIGEELSPLTHEQVMETANRTKPMFIALVKAFVREV